MHTGIYRVFLYLELELRILLSNLRRLRLSKSRRVDAHRR